VSGSQTKRLREFFAVNFLAGAESNLSGAVTGKWGGWGTEEEVRYEYASVLPYLILLALAGAMAHLWVIARQRGRT
jgi:membrane protein DedA with SNARE-associated domain